MTQWIHEYLVVGRRVPDANNPKPPVYRMRIFAPNVVVAKSRFWYFLKTLKKIKRSNGELLAIHEIFEKHPTTIKNYGIFVRYNSKRGTHNLTKEYRGLSRTGAVEQMYKEMAGRYHAQFNNIQIIDVKTLKGSEVNRPQTKQFINNKIRFPLPHRIPRPPHKRLHSTFLAYRPSTVW